MYKHTQIGQVIIFSMLAAFAVIGVAEFIASQQRIKNIEMIIIATAIILFITLLLFFSLTVIVNEEYVLVKFCTGIIRKKFLLKDIESCEVVKNRWWYGFGIRFIAGSGWMFNVSGLDAVELNLKNGKKFRIGTDEPKELARYICNRLI